MIHDAVEEMREARRSGMKVADIARQWNVSEATVSRYTQDVALVKPIKKRGPHLSKINETAEMYRLWVGGMTQEAIGQRFGISQGVVGRRMKTYRESLPHTEMDLIFQREMDLLEMIRARLMSIGLDTNQATGDRISAMREVRTGAERLAKMLGLDASDERDERRLRNEEHLLDMLDQVLRRVLTALGMDPEAEEVRGVVHRELALVVGE